MSKLAFLAALSTALAANIDIQVGNNGLNYSPNNVNASAGDTLTFHYVKGFHSVSQSSFDAPCDLLEGGFNSGIVPVGTTTAPNFVVTVKDNSPLWIYCAQESHCQSGMAMVVNQPAGKTLTMYQAAAKNAAQQSIDSTVVGGALSTPGGSVSTASSSATGVSNSTISTTASTGTAATGSASTTASGTASSTTGSGSTGSSTSSATPSSTTGAAVREKGDVLALMGAAALALFL